ncbi:rod shape-determining protein MreC [Cytobacillus horneckiae]|uniref:Cell shape-determining protein MreC n=1 Tax=Cytobacillus horneckiae TaxID=549687 RepID=A0A2N0ZJY1_9BACI|nr:rod shape-determining protein MreC [Cytobacillus horneckiae]MBN6887874.1 rod shape-determining protein MreC [Cytobacillus horneckiae]MCM3179772.1 rod shape-determining protein MreC [Cytobacillus horneckiae]MEC1155159.1 rod shape-determining protein MreC [Cytobacillus horneckiae]MED2935936.1 rod shape-determining protein MreC [Cytobacillus horneckiae]PKG29822.1 rod shape-determining protein MreC [Cytobacillus horneckiae]
MPQFFLNKRLIILLVSIIILVSLIGFSLRERENVTWPEQFLKDMTGWVQNIVAGPTQYIAGFFENVQDLQNTYTENKELKSRLDDLAFLEAEVQLLQKDNAELREILDKEESLSQYEPVQATVVGRNPDRWHEMLTINKGSRDGIEPNMAVITSNGLIGKVKSAQTFTSTVQLLSSMDPTNRISAVVQDADKDTEIFGLIEGYDEKRKLLMLTKIPYDAKVEKDQMVTTSGYGGVFPKGLPIGKVVEVTPAEYGLTQTAYIEPGADLYDIQHVMVTKISSMNPEIQKELQKGEEEEDN